MRNVNKDGADGKTLSLLKEGADAAKAAQAAGTQARSELEQRVQQGFNQVAEQIRMLQYALGNVFKTLGSYPAVKEQIDQLDYRTLGVARAIQELGLTADFNALVEKHALAAKVESFNELSAKDDEHNKYTVADDEAVAENHLVILTSECTEAPEMGIFRSKMDVGGEEFAAVKNDFLGKKVGESFTAKIQGKDHLVTVLGVRKKPDASPKV